MSMTEHLQKMAEHYPARPEIWTFYCATGVFRNREIVLSGIGFTENEAFRHAIECHFFIHPTERSHSIRWRKAERGESVSDVYMKMIGDFVRRQRELIKLAELSDPGDSCRTLICKSEQHELNLTADEIACWVVSNA